MYSCKKAKLNLDKTVMAKIRTKEYQGQDDDDQDHVKKNTAL